MLFKSFRSFKAPWSKMALMRETRVMSGHMKFHFSVISKSFSTKITMKRIFTCMYSHMNCITMLVHITSLTIKAYQGVVNFVFFLVNGQFVFCCTNFRTNLAFPLNSSILSYRRFHFSFCFLRFGRLVLWVCIWKNVTDTLF